jgi:hypothetical protein
MIILCPTCKGCGEIYVAKTPNHNSPKSQRTCRTCEKVGWINDGGPGCAAPRGIVLPDAPEDDYEQITQTPEVREAVKHLHDAVKKRATKARAVPETSADLIGGTMTYEQPREHAGAFFAPEESSVMNFMSMEQEQSRTVALNDRDDYYIPVRGNYGGTVASMVTSTTSIADSALASTTCSNFSVSATVADIANSNQRLLDDLGR